MRLAALLALLLLLVPRNAVGRETPGDRWVRFQDMLPLAKEDPQLSVLADMLTYDTRDLLTVLDSASSVTQSRTFELRKVRPSEVNIQDIDPSGKPNTRFWQLTYDVEDGKPMQRTDTCDTTVVARWDTRLSAFEDAVFSRREQMLQRGDPGARILEVFLYRVSRFRLELNLAGILLGMGEHRTASGEYAVNYEAVPAVIEISEAYGVHVPGYFHSPFGQQAPTAQHPTAGR